MLTDLSLPGSQRVSSDGSHILGAECVLTLSRRREELLAALDSFHGPARPQVSPHPVVLIQITLQRNRLGVSLAC